MRKIVRVPLALLLLTLGAGSLRAADTLVLAPDAYHESLSDWVAFRTEQGHSLQIVTPNGGVDAMREQVRQAASSGDLRYVLLVGDAPDRHLAEASCQAFETPIAYARAKVNVAWGALASIATDNPLADLDGDLSPELSVGRVPCRSPEQLRAYLNRVLARERAATASNGLAVVAAPGRFTPFVDALIEMTARSVLKQLAPAGYPISAIHASPSSSFFPRGDFRQAVMSGLEQDRLAWVYLGHGSSVELDHLWDQPGAPSILSCRDLHEPNQGGSPMLAAMLACRTGSIDEREDCLAERLLLRPGGPLAVIASSRVSMPYGNSVLGAEMLFCLFNHPGSLGDFVAEGKRRALREDSGLPVRAALGQIGRGVSPNPEALDLEVAEHVQMYNLLGDPLLRLR